MAEALRCPRCGTAMVPVVSGRYVTCQRCPIALGEWVYKPLGRAPAHPMDGKRALVVVAADVVPERPRRPKRTPARR